MNEKKYIGKRICSGILTGLFAGGVICLYRSLMTWCDTRLNHQIFPLLHSGSRLSLILWGIGLVALAFLVHCLIWFEPYAKGGGIPHALKEADGSCDARWGKVIFSKLLTAPLCILAGFSLGKTGPAIELGAMAGKGISSGLHRIRRLFLPRKEADIAVQEYVRSGSAAGLSALFNAPLAGLFFTWEKMKHHSFLSLFSILPASVTALVVSVKVYGHAPIVDSHLSFGQWQHYACLAILGIFLGILGCFYSGSLTFFTKILAENRRQAQLSLWIFAFLLAGIVGYFCPEITGGGTNLLAAMSDSHTTFRMLLFLLLGKYLFSMISSGSGLPGGTVFPLLTVGACLGQLFGIMANTLFPALALSPFDFILPGMAGFFTSVIGAPITGVFLLCEFSCDYTNFLPLAVTCLMSHILARIINR